MQLPALLFRKSRVHHKTRDRVLQFTVDVERKIVFIISVILLSVLYRDY